MFTIKKKPLTPNIIWDANAGKPLCCFGHRGMLTTNDRDLAGKLAAMGHEVTGEAEERQEVPGDGDGISDAAGGAEEQPGDGAGDVLPEGMVKSEPEAGMQAGDPATKGRRSRK